MKGMLWQNTLTVGIIIIIYFVVLLSIQYIYSTMDATPILSGWRAAEPAYASTMLDFFKYFVVPVVIIVTFIVFTKPQNEVVVVGGYR